MSEIEVSILEREFGNIQTREIVVTGERLNHIKMRHPEDFEWFCRFGKICVINPDWIVRDIKNQGTVFMIKGLPGVNLNVIVRLSLEPEDSNLKNSIMTFYRIREKNLTKLIEKNILLYKKE